MKLAECFQKGLLKRISPDMDNADRNSDLNQPHTHYNVPHRSIRACVGPCDPSVLDYNFQGYKPIHGNFCQAGA